MKNKFRVLYALLLIGLSSMMIYSCSKDHDPPPDQKAVSSMDHTVSNRSVQSSTQNEEEVPMVLGRQMTNPYTVQNITSAYNNLYNLSVSSLNATHRYVKFSPNDGDHLAILDDWERENVTPVFDFPLDYEITTPGDAYYDPSAPDSVFTFRYASVPVGLALPNVPNTIISDLFIPPNSSYLTEQAFYQVNEEYDGNTDRVESEPPGDGDPDPPVDPCNPGCGDYPCCKLPWYDCGNKPCTPVLPPDCYPGSANWPDCLDLDPLPVGPDVYPPPPPPPPPEDEYCECSEYEQGQLVYTYTVKLNPGESCDDLEESHGGLDIRCGESGVVTGGNGNGGGPENECGCPIPSNPRRPAGCVQVDNGIGGFESVKKVMVKTRDKWFSGDVVFTTEQGCWQVNKTYSKRWIWVWVEFQNDNAKVRAARKWYFWKAAVVADDYIGLFKNQPFNNFLVKYDNGENDVKGLTRMYWGCAHTMNADFEYREETAADGVIRPRTGLNYLLNDNDNSGGGAPMLQNLFFSQWPKLLQIFTQYSLGLLGQSFSLYPDITAGYGTDPFALPLTRDNYKSILFHELGHASHYRLVGESYWIPYRTHIIVNDAANNGVYGSFGNFAMGSSPGEVALGEAIGSFTGNRYGGSATGGEGISFDNPLFIPQNFIPRGLIFDLIDNGVDIVFDPNNPSIFATDNISGFTPNMIFQSLSPNVSNIREFRDRLSTLHLVSTPNTLTVFNNFVDVYDVFN